MENNVKVYALTPDVSNRYSFYNRAFIIELPNGVRLLKSYDTIVCGVNTRGHFFRLWNGWSATTARHIDAFKRTFVGGYGIGKKSWQEMPINPRYVSRYAGYKSVSTPAYKVTYY